MRARVRYSPRGFHGDPLITRRTINRMFPKRPGMYKFCNRICLHRYPVSKTRWQRTIATCIAAHVTHIYVLLNIAQRNSCILGISCDSVHEKKYKWIRIGYRFDSLKHFRNGIYSCTFESAIVNCYWKTRFDKTSCYKCVLMFRAAHTKLTDCYTRSRSRDAYRWRRCSGRSIF